MRGPIDVTEADFEERVVAASRERPVVVDFWAAWCGPCRVLGPALERLTAEHEGRVLLAKVDVDANQRLAARFGVQGIPAVKAFRDGQIVSEFVGAQPEQAIRAFLDEIVPSPAGPHLAEGASAWARGDLEDAEAAYRRALEADPRSAEAAAGLARVVLRQGDLEEARRLIAPLDGAPELAQVSAELALRESVPEDADELRRQAAAGDSEALLAVAASEATAGDAHAALDRALALVEGGGEAREQARRTILLVFRMLGDDHPLTAEFRPKLARALF